ncbi:serpin family protein [Jongsikchunia kroppenstedtii]|uniref:serpin family protein n=1 Tax=Jongsikchunia kroppenstedtii TaxID=1121721 RepID=UPI0003A4B664|nr:serpin family protein [Jongsikchunia kroppenstedtii]
MTVRRWGIVAMALLLLAGCSTSTSTPTSVALSKAPKVQFDEVGIDQVRDGVPAVVAATTRLGLALAPDAAASNALVAPWSTATLLAMLRTGASGVTAAQLDRLLGGASTETVTALIGQVQQVDGDPGTVTVDAPPQTPVYHQGVGLFIRKSIPVEQDFLRHLGTDFGTGYYPVDFSGNDPLAGVSEWLSVNTGSDSARAPADIAAPTSSMTAMTSAFLSAAWASPFADQSTGTGAFTTGDGAALTVPFMSGMPAAQSARGAGWAAVRLPFGPGLAMNILLPDPAVPASAITSDALLDADAALRSAPSQSTPVTLPRWSFHGSADIAGALARLGATAAVSQSADFAAIGPGAHLSAAVARSAITIGERGTVAASTDSRAIAPLPPSPANGFVADRPFVYEIVDTATGLPLYYGRVSNPGVEQ